MPQAHAIADVVMRVWETTWLEPRAATWFRNTYLGDKLDWCAHSPPMLGVAAHIQPQESWHNHSKNSLVHLRRANDLFFNVDMPRFLRSQTRQFAGKPISPDFAFEELSEHIHGAVDYLHTPGAFLMMDGDLFLNSDVHDPKGHGNVTPQRARAYLRSLSGDLGSRANLMTLDGLERHFLSLHRVHLGTGGLPTCDCEKHQEYGSCLHSATWRALHSPQERERFEALCTPFGELPPAHRPRQATPALVRQPPDDGNASAGRQPRGRGRGRRGSGRGRGRSTPRVEEDIDRPSDGESAGEAPVVRGRGRPPSRGRGTARGASRGRGGRGRRGRITGRWYGNDGEVPRPAWLPSASDGESAGEATAAVRGRGRRGRPPGSGRANARGASRGRRGRGGGRALA